MIGDDELIIEIFMATPLKLAEPARCQGSLQKGKKWRLISFNGLDGMMKFPNIPEKLIEQRK
jgi:hypothetical protein